MGAAIELGKEPTKRQNCRNLKKKKELLIQRLGQKVYVFSVQNGQVYWAAV